MAQTGKDKKRKREMELGEEKDRKRERGCGQEGGKAKTTDRNRDVQRETRWQRMERCVAAGLRVPRILGNCPCLVRSETSVVSSAFTAFQMQIHSGCDEQGSVARKCPQTLPRGPQASRRGQQCSGVPSRG